MYLKCLVTPCKSVYVLGLFPFHCICNLPFFSIKLLPFTSGNTYIESPVYKVLSLYNFFIIPQSAETHPKDILPFLPVLKNSLLFVKLAGLCIAYATGPIESLLIVYIGSFPG